MDEEYEGNGTEVDERDYTDGLNLSQKIIRKEVKPTTEACTKLMILRSKFGNEYKNLPRIEKDMLNFVDQAINICRDDINKVMYEKPKKKDGLLI